MAGKKSEKRLKHVIKLRDEFDNDIRHSNQVMFLTERLIAQLQENDLCPGLDPIYAKAGALLHDIGQSIQLKKHHLHSRDIILENGIRDFNNKEIRAIAMIAMYHRKSLPSIEQDEFRQLSEKWQQIVKHSSAVVRIADGLDRTHRSLVKDVTIKVKKRKAKFYLSSEQDVSTEIWGALRKKELLETALGIVCSFVSGYDNIFQV